MTAWVCGHCGSEDRCGHPRVDRVALDGLTRPRKGDEFFELVRVGDKWAMRPIAFQRGKKRWESKAVPRSTSLAAEVASADAATWARRLARVARVEIEEQTEADDE